MLTDDVLDECPALASYTDVGGECLPVMAKTGEQELE
jgi:hypothetical protein